MLSRDEMRQIKGGSGGSPCRIFIRLNSVANYWTGCNYSVSAAQFHYGSHYSSGYRVTGYCCASCASPC